MIELSAAQEARAARLHNDAVVVNALDTSYSILEDKYFQKLRTGGVDVTWVTVGGGSLTETVDEAAKMLATIAKNSDEMVQVTTAAEMEQAKRDGKVAVLFGTQNASCVEDDPRRLEVLYRLGYRCMGITYSGGNYLGAGCGERTRETQGLSFAGVDVLNEMNRLGILVDMSHSGDATTWDVLKLSKKTVVFTHCNARALIDTARNKPDDQIKAMADTGGVMGVVALSRMLNLNPREATLEDMLDHIDYIVNLVGVDHVGIGLDQTDATERFAKPPARPELPNWRMRRPDMLGTFEDFYSVPYAKDISDNSMVPNITRGLVARGYSDEDILKIMGGNWLRVFEEVIGAWPFGLEKG
jgi:membrane dipeptidase